MLLIPFLIFGWIGNKISYTYFAANKELETFFINIGDVITDPLPSFRPFDLLVGAAAGSFMLIVLHFKKKNAKKYRHGEEYGSASWGTLDDIKAYVDFTNFANNVILTQTERLTMGKPSAPKYYRSFSDNKDTGIHRKAAENNSGTDRRSQERHRGDARSGRS